MSTTCPGCGAAMELTEAPARLLSGTCAGCGRSVTVLEGTHPPRIPGDHAAPEGDLSKTDDDAEPTASGPECPECAAPMTVQLVGPQRLEVGCADCGTTTVYAPERAAPIGTGDERPTRSPRFGGARPRGPDRGDRFERPPGRPCRECGGQLRFSTSEDGLVTGECTSCGNRFTLPPRREGGRGRGPPDFRSSRGGFRPRFGSPRGGDRRERGGGRPVRSSRPYSRSDDDEGDGRERRRRRPPREDSR